MKDLFRDGVTRVKGSFQLRRMPTYAELGERINLLEVEIGRRTQLKGALSQSEDIYKTILENSLAGIYVVVNGHFRVMNSIAASYTGYPLEELIGKRWDSFIFPEDKAEVKRNSRNMLAGIRTAPYVFRIVTKQNQLRWVMETVTSTMFQGRPAILGNSMDLTERKTVEQRLEESENLYRAIFETTGTATIIIEDDMMISLINSEFEKLTGYRKEDWEGKKRWTEYVVREDLARMRRYHRLRRTDPASAPRNYEHGLVDGQGRVRNIFLTVDMIPGTKKSVASFIDITDWKEAERGLKKREEELRTKSRNLQELNTALRVLLKQREQDREEFEEKVLTNVREFVLPYIEKIKKDRLDLKYRAYVDILESNLQDIISPFSHKLSSQYLHLTPREIQVANFIKGGKTSKEIADLLNVSRSAIDIHRYRIRNKLGLNNKKANLRSHLSHLA